MTKNFNVADLVQIFRSGLLALLPVMDAARIRWVEPGVYDPWEDIARTLYSSILGSCVENAVPAGARPLVRYGLNCGDYKAYSFISERGLRSEGKLNAFVELQIGNELFNTALLCELRASLIPTGRTFTKPISVCAFDLATHTADGTDYHQSIDYEE